MKQLHTYTARRIALLLATFGFLQAVAVVPTAHAQQASRLVFAVPVFTVIENQNERATLTVSRIGDASGAASVTYATSDTATSLARCDTVSGIASERCDYSTSIDTLRFAPGKTSKSFTVPIISDTYNNEGTEEFRVTLSNAVGAEVGLFLDSARVRIFDGLGFTVFDPSLLANPSLQTQFFVRQHYLDFLSREPEASGFADWTRVLSGCSNVNNNPACDRITVSTAFFTSEEFQLKGYFVYKFYKATLNRLPRYGEIIPDMRRVTGAVDEEVVAKREQFARSWVEREDFRLIYAGTTNAGFVDKLLQTASVGQQITIAATGVTLMREQLIGQLETGAKTRAEVVRQVVESREVDQREYNGAFVAMQYFGYLRRDPEPEGYEAWLRVITANSQDRRTMVNGFVNSTEYRLRFGQP